MSTSVRRNSSEIVGILYSDFIGEINAWEALDNGNRNRSKTVMRELIGGLHTIQKQKV